MQKTYLFPNSVRLYGWIAVAVSAILFVLCLIDEDIMNMTFHMPAVYDDMATSKLFRSTFHYDRCWFVMAETTLFTTVVPALFIIGALLVCFSKEKREDELTCKLREQSLVWAIEIGFGVLLIAYLFFYGFSFIIIRRFIVDLFLVLFFVKFRIAMYRLGKEIGE